MIRALGLSSPTGVKPKLSDGMRVGKGGKVVGTGTGVAVVPPTMGRVGGGPAGVAGALVGPAAAVTTGAVVGGGVAGLLRQAAKSMALLNTIASDL